jgi:hypothetical protein
MARHEIVGVLQAKEALMFLRIFLAMWSGLLLFGLAPGSLGDSRAAGLIPERTHMSKQRKVPRPAEQGGQSVGKTCPSCRAKLGKPHSSQCDKAVCWECRQQLVTCQCQRASAGKTIPWTGDLELVFALNNRLHYDPDLDEWDHSPCYREGNLVALRTSRVDIGVWRAVMASPQAKSLTGLTFARPQLSLQQPEDAARALPDLPRGQQFKHLQIGLAQTTWDAGADGSDAIAEGKDPTAVVQLIEQMPQLVRLYLAVTFPSLDAILTACLPRTLREFCLNTTSQLDLGLLATNASLAKVEGVSLVRCWKADPADEAFLDHLRAFLSSPYLESVKQLNLEMPEVNDAACAIVAQAEILKKVRYLRLAGRGVSDEGAAVLAASPVIRGLEGLCLDGPELTAEGIDTLRNAGVKLSSAMLDASE